MFHDTYLNIVHFVMMTAYTTTVENDVVCDVIQKYYSISCHVHEIANLIQR